MKNTGLVTEDGLWLYDLEPQSSELMVVAGPPDFVGTIDPDHLPHGFRWVEDEEWEELLNANRDEPEDSMTDAEADADALSSAGYGTDEDYGYYGDGGDDF